MASKTHGIVKQYRLTTCVHRWVLAKAYRSGEIILVCECCGEKVKDYV